MSDDANTDMGVAGDTSAIAVDSDEVATVSVDSLDRAYASGRWTVEALSGMGFAVEDGKFVCVIGPSGCDRTILFRVIVGLKDATSGTVTLDGSPVTGPGTDRGMVFQGYELFPWWAVSENVASGFGEQGVKESTHSKRMTEMPELVGLDDSADAYPREPSGEMKQRVDITRALAVDPELFFMDGPFGAVDTQTHDTLHGELFDIWAETDKTALFVTHNVEEAVTFADRVVAMAASPGRVRKIVSVDIDRLCERTESESATYIERIHGLIGE